VGAVIPLPLRGRAGWGYACEGEREREYPECTSNDRSQPSDASFQVDGGQTNIPGGHQSCEPERGCACSLSLASRIVAQRCHAEKCGPRDQPDD